MAATNYFYDLPREIQCDIIERCGKAEWKENFKKISMDLKKEANNRRAKRMYKGDFTRVLFASRTNIDALWALRTF